MPADRLANAVHLTDLATRTGIADLRHHARRVGLIALRHALTIPESWQRDTTVADVFRRSGLDGYGQLLAVSEAARLTVCCRHCIDRKLRLSDASVERGRMWIEAVLDGDQRMIRALAPRHRRADIREDETYLLAGSAFEALRRLASPTMVVRAMQREAQSIAAQARIELTGEVAETAEGDSTTAAE